MSKQWWWLSFVDTRLPDEVNGSQFVGAAIVQGNSLKSAIRVAHEIGAYPANVDEVAGVPIPEEELGRYSATQRNRLMLKLEVMGLDVVAVGDVDDQHPGFADSIPSVKVGGLKAP